ncbi:phospholipase D zeta 1-like isoform X3 [Lycium barbarum]|uniref:phospholipase D zeta 1-like isoform X3 n=1 Tax=Lycium barbarum TaxID=112863 RepID=UPI00293EB8D1|nr:phospholipase D zeta 1-like isoform X3 [Lycium barbarum]
MSTERLLENAPASAVSSTHSLRYYAEPTTIFEELPKASIIGVSRGDASDISPLLLSYTIEVHYKQQFKWRLLKKASQVIYLHFALRKRAIIEELQEKQEQVKEWLHHIGIGEQTAVIHDDDEDDGAVPIYNEDSIRKRCVPSRAALPIIRPALGRQQTITRKAKLAMQEYLNHFLGDLDIVNSREVCKFLEVSKLSFLPEYGPKLKENYVMVKHLSKVPKEEENVGCCICYWSGCCKSKWQKVWAVLKPGYLALLNNPFDAKLLDIIVFDVLPTSNGKGEHAVSLAEEIRERNPLQYAFKVSCGNRSIMFRTTSDAKVNDWISAINDAVLKPPEGWCNPHRFGSFAPLRGTNDDATQAQWFIDGKSAFEAIASSIESAKSEIYITGWWLCPELYLRRPYHNHSSSRLDALLETKAKEGVQIYVLLYKEVSIALKINSLYSKRKLLKIHKNVKVLRYPNHFSAGIYLWSHHEKLVIVDNKICYIGGLDLCFGRYDTREHKLGDQPPFIWPGKDYYNPRESEPNSWEDAMKDELEREKYPRMPWHDVHCAIWGPPCRDIARHFVQRWNHAKRSKAPNEQTIPLLMPQHHMVLPHYMGRSREVEVESKTAELNSKDLNGQDPFPSGSPPEDIPLLLPQEADCDEEVSCADEKLTDDLHHRDLQSHIKTHQQDNWWETQERVAEVISTDEIADVGPRTRCHCQVIRSVSQWSAGTTQTEDSIHKAYCSLIEEAEHFVFIENQFFISGLAGDEIIRNRVADALYRRIRRAHKENRCFRVIIVIPLLPGFQGGLDDIGAATVRALMHWQYRTICKGNNSILHNLNALLGPETRDYISFYGLRTHGQLSDVGPMFTSQVYVHSKVMIVDDRIAVVGSSNINDRSLLGSRDSEICVVIEDKDFIDSTMDGEPWKAGKFAFSLRVSLWAEHLGLRAEEICQIKDPAADSTYKDIWMATAESNATIYQAVFSCIPNDLVHSRSELRQCMNHWKDKLGHTTIDLGVAPDKLEFHDNGQVAVVNTKEKLKSVKGHLVSFPLEFMREEDLRPVFIETEFYTSPQVFY